eukprot:g2734.t1
MRHVHEAFDLRHVHYERKGAVARVILARPQVRNAISRGATFELDRCFTQACKDERVRVIALLAEGAHFSSGHDLGSDDHLAEMEGAYEHGVPGDFEKWSELDVEMCLKWRQLRKPLVCGVQGFVIYHGCAVASCADLVVAASDLKMMPGLVEYNHLPWDLSLRVRRAKEILFLQRFVLAPEARELGLVNMVVPPERLDAETMALARAVARSDPYYLRMAKRMCDSATAAAGAEANMRAGLDTWTSYRWGWHERIKAREAAGGGSELTVDHGGRRKTLAPVPQALEDATMRWSWRAAGAAAGGAAGGSEGGARSKL